MTLDDEDIQTLMKVFATKDDLKNLVTKQDLQDLENRLEEKFVTNDRFDDALSKLDFIIGELKNMREENAIHQAKHDRIEEDLAAIKAIPTITH